MISISTATALLLRSVDWTLFLQACLCSGFSLGGLCTVTLGAALMLCSLLLLLPLLQLSAAGSAALLAAKLELTRSS